MRKCVCECVCRLSYKQKPTTVQSWQKNKKKIQKIAIRVVKGNYMSVPNRFQMLDYNVYSAAVQRLRLLL